MTQRVSSPTPDGRAAAAAGGPGLAVRDLGRTPYRNAYAIQRDAQRRVIDARGRPDAPVGELLLVEHDPVVTVTRRPRAASHVLADGAALAAAGVDLVETDRGGDVTYHGPGQLVAYPIIDLARAGLRLHAYVRLLEQAAIDTIARYGVVGVREPGATGVWVPTGAGTMAKVCAIGVRVRKWVTMHGLALNVRPDLGHFGLIVPCGLVGRPVTSLEVLLGEGCPDLARVKADLADSLHGLLGAGAGAGSGEGPPVSSS